MSRYNPCGRVVDIGHTEYVTTWKPYPDSDLTEEILWYEARDDAPLLGMISANNNLAWDIDRDEYLETAVGQVVGAPWRVVQTAAHLLALGTHVCGTAADFAGMGSYPGPDPPVTLRPDKLPFCCGALFQGNGGLGLGGSDIVTPANPVLAQVLSSGGDPPVHVCQRMTRDTSNAIVAFSPTTIFSQVLNQDECTIPDGMLVQIYEIEDWPGWFWALPTFQYADTQTVTLALDTSTDIVTAEVVTQLSVDQDSAGVKLKGDSVPSADQYYGTPSGGTSLGYQSVATAVAAAASSPAVVTAFQLAIFGSLPQNNFKLFAAGGGVFVVGLDATVASTTTELLDNVTALSANNSGQLLFAAESTIYTNSFNAEGLLIDRTAGTPSTATDTITFEGGDSIEVTSASSDNTFTISTVHQMSITSDLDGLKLVNDQATPGNSCFYSTDNTGTKGWHVSDGVWIENVSGTWSHIGPQSSGGTTVSYPASITFDSRGHISAYTSGTEPVQSISTTNATGGPLVGNVTLSGGTAITLSVSGQTITINGSGGTPPYGPAPTSAPTLEAVPGNDQVSLSWSAVAGAVDYYLYNGSTLIYSSTGTSYTNTGLTNGTSYSYEVYGYNNALLGPGGTASATPGPYVLYDDFTTNTGTMAGRAVQSGTATPTNWVVGSGTWAAAVGTCSLTVGSGSTKMTTWAQSGQANVTVQLVCNCPNTANWFGGILFRGLDNGDYLFAGLERDSSGTPYIGLTEVISGTATGITSTNLGASSGTTVTLQVVASSSTINIYVNGALEITHASTQFESATLMGLVAANGGGYTPVSFGTFWVTSP